MGVTVCPLGLCRFEEDCPNAPCLDCMRRLGDHLIDEIKLLERQTAVASTRGDVGAMSALDALLTSLGIAIISREHKVA